MKTQFIIFTRPLKATGLKRNWKFSDSERFYQAIGLKEDIAKLKYDLVTDCNEIAYIYDGLNDENWIEIVQSLGDYEIERVVLLHHSDPPKRQLRLFKKALIKFEIECYIIEGRHIVSDDCYYTPVFDAIINFKNGSKSLAETITILNSIFNIDDERTREIEKRLKDLDS